MVSVWKIDISAANNKFPRKLKISIHSLVNYESNITTNAFSILVLYIPYSKLLMRLIHVSDNNDIKLRLNYDGIGSNNE